MAEYDVIEVRPVEHLKLQVRFADGLSGTVELRPSHLFGALQPLNDPEFFMQASCKDGFVSWPGEIDLSPDAMYDAIRAHGTWVLA